MTAHVRYVDAMYNQKKTNKQKAKGDSNDRCLGFDRKVKGG